MISLLKNSTNTMQNDTFDNQDYINISEVMKIWENKNKLEYLKSKDDKIYLLVSMSDHLHDELVERVLDQEKKG